jgi:hypothetical protein
MKKKTSLSDGSEIDYDNKRMEEDERSAIKFDISLSLGNKRI